MRNSSLVEYFRAENVPGLEHTTEVADSVAILSGRGAFHTGVKQDREDLWTVWK